MLDRGMSKLQHKERRDTCVYTSASVSNRTGILVLGGGGSCSPAADFFFCAISGAGQEREPSVHYDTCRDPRRGPWRCSERSTSLKWLFFSRSQVRVNGKPYNLSCSLSTARSHFTFFQPLRSSAWCTTSVQCRYHPFCCLLRCSYIQPAAAVRAQSD